MSYSLYKICLIKCYFWFNILSNFMHLEFWEFSERITEYYHLNHIWGSPGTISIVATNENLIENVRGQNKNKR